MITVKFNGATQRIVNNANEAVSAVKNILAYGFDVNKICVVATATKEDGKIAVTDITSELKPLFSR